MKNQKSKKKCKEKLTKYFQQSVCPFFVLSPHKTISTCDVKMRSLDIIFQLLTNLYFARNITSPYTRTFIIKTKVIYKTNLLIHFIYKQYNIFTEKKKKRKKFIEHIHKNVYNFVFFLSISNNIIISLTRTMYIFIYHMFFFYLFKYQASIQYIIHDLLECCMMYWSIINLYVYNYIVQIYLHH